MSKKLIVTNNEILNFNEFISKFINCQNCDCKKYSNLNAMIVDFSNDKHINSIIKIIDSALEKTFNSISEVFVNENAEDYQYTDKDDRFNEIVKRILYYGEINDIFDLFANIFIQMISSHKLKNGNKRFCLFFLVNLLYEFGYYFNWPLNTGNIGNYNQFWEHEVFCFVSRLSNRKYEDFISSFNDSELRLDNDKSQIYKWCYNLIKENDKLDTVKERQDKVRKEVKGWIIKNTTILEGENYA